MLIFCDVSTLLHTKICADLWTSTHGFGFCTWTYLLGLWELERMELDLWIVTDVLGLITFDLLLGVGLNILGFTD